MELSTFRSPRIIISTNRKNPLDRRRNLTDGNFVFIFAFIFMSWLALIIFAFIGNIGPTDSSNNTHVWILIGGFFKNYYAAIGITICSVMISMLIFLLMLRFCPKFFIYFGAVIFVIAVIIFAALICFKIYTMKNSGNFLYYIRTSSLINIYIVANIYFITLLICIERARVSVIAEILKKISQVFFPCFHLILFPIIVFLLEILVVFLTVLSCSSDNSNYGTCIVLFLGAYYLLFFTFYLGRMIIAPAIATWHWTQNKKDIPKTLMFQHFHEIIRNHFGSAAHAALPIFSLCTALIEACKRKSHNNRYHSNCLINFFLSIYLILGSGGISTIVTAIYGHNFCKSTRKTFDLLMRNSPLSLIFLKLVFFILVLQIGFTAFVAHVSLGISPSKEGEAEYEKFIVWFIAILMMPVFILFDLIADVSLICTLQNDEDNDSLQERSMQVTINPRVLTWV